MLQYKFDAINTLDALKHSGKPFNIVLDHEHVLVEVYKPIDQDYQQPHDRDEFYIIISGTGKFRYLDQVMDFKPGDLFFVPAHQEHRFTSFTNDFATWVIFTGPVKLAGEGNQPIQ